LLSHRGGVFSAHRNNAAEIIRGETWRRGKEKRARAAEDKGEIEMTQNPNQTARVLPFRVIAFRVPARKFEEIEEHLKFAAWLINQDAPLDWEDRNTACRRLHDALCLLAEVRKSSNFKM
jgi:hypothetical protein